MGPADPAAVTGIVGHKPKSLGFGESAAFPLTSITAWLASRLGPKVERPGDIWVSLVASLAFIGLKVFEFRAEIVAGMLPRTSTFFATYFTLTGLHGLHIIGGALVMAAVVADIVGDNRARRDAVPS